MNDETKPVLRGADVREIVADIRSRDPDRRAEAVGRIEALVGAPAKAADGALDLDRLIALRASVQAMRTRARAPMKPRPSGPLDAVYVFRHSVHADVEIKYSLRSIAANAPWIRKVWIFGDRPDFLSTDASLVEHVPQEAIAGAFDVKYPVRNFFLMMFFTSLIPELSFEYLFFSDDFFVIDELTPENACRDRMHRMLSAKEPRHRQEFIDAIWRTYDLITNKGYTAFNFETHVPAYLTKKRVFDAYRDLREYVVQDPLFGPLGLTAVLNHAHRHESMDLISIHEEKCRVGYWDSPPAYETVVADAAGRTFLNFNDRAFGPGLRKFLHERFPEPCKYEAPE